jgi:NTE family protein
MIFSHKKFSNISFLQNKNLLKYSRKNIKILCLSFHFLFLLPKLNLAANLDSTLVDVITLEYEHYDGPPNCVIPHKTLKRPKVGLALSGGGLRGIAQLGVIKALRDNNVPVDYIVGSSIGGLLGGLVASGYSPEEIWEIAQSIDWNNVLDDTPSRSTLFLGEKEEYNRSIINFRLDGIRPSLPEAFTPGFKLTDILTNLIINAPYHSTDFTKFPISLKIISTDLRSGKKAIFTRGDLTEVIRASIAIPLLLTPVEIDSMLLVDGGVLDNIPVDETKQFGADIVIAVDTTSPLRTRDNMEMPWEVLDQVTTIMQLKQKKEQLNKADIVIDLSDVAGTSTELDNLDLFYREGQKRALAQIDKLKLCLRQRTTGQTQKYNIHQIADFEGLSRFHNLKQKSVLSKQDLLNVLYSLQETGKYDSVYAKILNVNNHNILEIKTIPKIHISRIEFTGIEFFPDSVLQSVVKPLLNQPLTHHLSQDIILRILKKYRKSGLSLAQIKNINFDKTTQSAHVKINEGKIGKLEISGNKITKDFVINREFKVVPNNTFHLKNMQEGISSLYASGLFKSIIFKTQPNGDLWDFNLSLKEKLPHLVRLGVKYDRERNGCSFLEFSDENFWGTGNDLTIHGQYGDRDVRGAFNYRANRINKTLLTSTLDIHYDKGKHFAYQDFRGVGEYERKSLGSIFSLGRHIERFGTLSFFLRMERIYIRSISGYGYDTGKLNINTIGFRTIIDTRDHVPFPKSGKYHNFLYEVSAGEFLGADISYFKVQNSLATFLTIFKRNTFCPILMWGTSDLTTPYSEQFRIGGQNSFYGMREGEMQGRHVVLGSLEYRYWLPINFIFDTYFSMRFDVGAVWANVLEAQMDDFTSGRGIALAFETPIGPISFSYGLTEMGKKVLYFNAGYDF